MEHFINCINAVVPFFLTIGTGWLVVRLRWVKKSFMDGLNLLVFRLFVPCVLFFSIYRADLQSAFAPKLIAYCVGVTLVVYLLVWAIGARCLERRQLGSFVQACYRGNYVIFAIPMISALLGSEVMGRATLVTPFIVSTYSVLAAIVFTVTGERQEGSAIKQLGRIGLGIVKTPFIIGILLALPLNLLQIHLPAVVETGVEYMSDMGTPAALLSIGGTLSWNTVRSNWKLSILAVGVKNVVLPLCMIIPAVHLGFQGLDLAIISTVGLAPTALNSYSTAKNMGGDAELASSCVVLSTLCALVTIVFALTVMRNTGLF